MKHPYTCTKNFVCRNAFSHMKQRCLKYGYELGYTSNQLLEWALSKDEFHSLFNEWVISGYQRKDAVSFDRKDCYKGYSFDNLQITKWRINNLKGVMEVSIKRRKRVLQRDSIGEVVFIHDSITDAAASLNISRWSVHKFLYKNLPYKGFNYEIEDTKQN